MNNTFHKDRADEIIRKKDEKDFHDKFFAESAERKAQEKFYAKEVKELLFNYAISQMGDLKGRKLLYYGCGINKKPLSKFISEGAEVKAIDLSSEAVEIMKKFIIKEKLNDYAEMLEMDAEKLSFDNNMFDLVFGSAIIHHLDIRKASSEISRILKKGGKAIFIEPLGMNPIINFYRLVTPKDRTKDEHPLKMGDVDTVKKNFTSCRQKNFFFLALGAFFWKYIRNEALFRLTFKIFVKADNCLFKVVPFFKRYCWCTVITLQK